MNKTIYKRIHVEGFQSMASPLSIVLDNVGLNLIKGVNGVGKSTLINAILWAEYGVNLKKSVSTWGEVRPSDYRGTRVIIERTDGVYDYMIARHLDFKGNTKGLKGQDRLMIFKKGVDEPKFEASHLVADGLHKKDMQDIINGQLGMDSTAFLNSVIFGQRLAGLITMDNKNKRALFEQLFDVAFVDVAKENAKAKKLEVEKLIETCDNDIKITEITLENTQALLDKDETTLKGFEKTKKDRVDAVTLELKDKTAEFDKYKKEFTDCRDEQAKINLGNLEELKKALSDKELEEKQAKVAKTSAEGCVDDVVKKIKGLKSKNDSLKDDLDNIDETCPTCTQPLPKDKVAGAKDKIKKDIKANEDTIKVLEKELKTREDQFKKADKEHQNRIIEVKDLETRIGKFKDLETKLVQLKASETSLSRMLKTAEDNVKQTKARLDKEKNEKAPNLDLDKHRKTIKSAKDNIAIQNKKLETHKVLLDKVNWWINKGFGVQGLKSFVFNAMLTQLNSYAHKYAGRLGFRVEFSIDTSKASRPFQTLIYRGDLIKDYEDLSGGQKQRVDICIAFAMHDLISHNSDINILVMDELFEGLDNEGIETAFELIRTKAERKSVYLITHADLVDTMGARSITFELDEKGVTYLKA